MLSSSRDNWERLVAAVLKREQLWQLFHQQSRSPSISTISSDFSGQILNNSLGPISLSPPPQVPLRNASAFHVSNNASGLDTRKLFSGWYRRKKPQDKFLIDIPEDLGIYLEQVRRFSLREIKAATDNFSNKIEFYYGGHLVYRGQLADGSLVAVKRYTNSGDQSAELQFRKEVEINNIAVHPNVLHMLGVCITPKERLLVYPLMVNGSVESCLRGRHESHPPLDWLMRKRIALGVAKGLAHLHYECGKKIIHHNVNAATILLDADFEAVIGDFELSWFMDHNVSYCRSTSIVGTIAFIMAPDYRISGYRWSERSDVLCYGIFLLELITGQSVFDLARLANDEDVKFLGWNFLHWVKRNLKEKKWERLIDPDIGCNDMEEVVEQLMQIALLCTQINPEGWPKMSEVVKMLEDGDGMAERWEEWYKEDVEKEDDLWKNYPNSDRMICYDTYPAPEELSGPR